SRAVASSSSAHTSFLHTSAVLQVASAARKRKSRIAEKANLEKRQKLVRAAQAIRPHVVLGNRPGDEDKWRKCDLSRVIITEEDILASPIPPASASENLHEVLTPQFFAYGIGEREKELLFSTLPNLSVEGAYLHEAGADGRMDLNKVQEADAVAKQSATALARMIDLRNANARGIAFENRRRIIAEFSEPEKPMDTGRPEVQAALITYKIRNLWNHLITYKRDIGNRRSLRLLVHQRAKVLKYLKKVDKDRYERVLQRLGLEAESVEGELVV
ncbi:mitochondrial ribosomal protein S15, partial [Wolfiporia cocos MD-104 SS10]